MFDLVSQAQGEHTAIVPVSTALVNADLTPETTPLALGDVDFPISAEHLADCARDVGGHDARWKRLTGKPVGSASEGSAIRTPTTKSLCQGVYGSYHFCEQDLSDASERRFRDLNEMLKRTALNAGVSESEFELPLYELVLTSETGPVHRVLLLRVFGIVESNHIDVPEHRS